jgi:hypothetical protein
MKLEEMSFERQVQHLRSLLGSGKNSLLSYFALFALRHHLASKHSPAFTQKPVIRWYLGQLAKEYIAKYFDDAKKTLENFAETGLLAASEESEGDREYHLNEAVYPALLDVLKEIFGEECIRNSIARTKYYKNPGTPKNRDHKSDEVRG